jgi:CHASE3 domain sensor protein
MTSHWTFGRKIGFGFAIISALALAIGFLAMYTMREVIKGKDRVLQVDFPLLVNAERLHVARGDKALAFRAYLFTGDERYIGQLGEARDEIARIIAAIRKNSDEKGQRLVDAIEQAEAAHQRIVEDLMAMHRGGATPATITKAFEERGAPARTRLDRCIDDFSALEAHTMEEARTAANQAAATATILVTALGAALAIIAGVTAWLLTTALGRQIGTAVGQVQSSSAELQAAANQQATGAKEQATAMNEITTTINELLATSRQIAESAQRVAGVAEQAVGAARAGDGTVQSACTSIGGIRRQVDQVVDHMLDLGRKSQQIGAVLDIVTELAEQTNILAINATIEAVGAGENGRRFAVVADEIRKLADRVAGSTKEIRDLIEDVRGAVNTTVMATETGSKAVDAGDRQVNEVAASFKRIAELVTTTTDAAREIELSTKQQATAVEQVNVAIANVAQTTRETEASSGQTLQTASQLAGLSKDLLRLVTSPTAG